MFSGAGPRRPHRCAAQGRPEARQKTPEEACAFVSEIIDQTLEELSADRSGMRWDLQADASCTVTHLNTGHPYQASLALFGRLRKGGSPVQKASTSTRSPTITNFFSLFQLDTAGFDTPHNLENSDSLTLIPSERTTTGRTVVWHSLAAPSVFAARGAF